ncbi:MAG: hypothetical protein ACI4DY_12235 [Monoglobaceae bacterium]
MKISKENDNRYIQDVRYDKTNNGLKWKQNGYDQFVILYSEEKEYILLSDNDTSKKICGVIEQNFDELKQNGHFYIDDYGTECFICTFAQLKKSGLQIDEKPGFYAVYGIEETDGEYEVFVDPNGKNNLRCSEVTLQVDIEQKECFIEKRHIFKKNESVYSGYKQVSVKQGHPEIDNGTLLYKVKKYSFPIPAEIVKNGGSFFVKCDQNERINFSSNNKGIHIR